MLNTRDADERKMTENCEDVEVLIQTEEDSKVTVQIQAEVDES